MNFMVELMKIICNLSKMLTFSRKNQVIPFFFKIIYIQVSFFYRFIFPSICTHIYCNSSLADFLKILHIINSYCLRCVDKNILALLFK